MIYLNILIIFLSFFLPISTNWCDECLQLSPDLHFCFLPNYEEHRCNHMENLKNCPDFYIEKNSRSNVRIIKDEEFRNFRIFDGVEDYNQLRPQKLKINLRKGDAVNFTFSYKPAEDYPLELYYLMDLTYSMKNDLQSLVKLAENLGYSLKNLSDNFKIAFGSYVEKLLMPFSFTNAANYENPCNGFHEKFCGKSYLMKHIQNFTDDLELFTKEVEKKSVISANLDDLEGGMEALMQVIVCGKRIGWSEISRKFVIISTGSLMHLAGDGILSGTVLRNPGRCLIDEQGNYPSRNPYDYPSLEEIHGALKKQKINAIFAVKPKVLNYYNSMKEVIKDSAFVGTLEENSRNIIQLTREGYLEVFKKARFSIESKHAADLDVNFYADCEGTGFNKSNGCDNIVLGRTYDFIVEFKLKNTKVKSEKIFIVERNIQEKIEVELEYFGFCKCEGPFAKIESVSCVNGDLRCGNCTCDPGWTGKFCNETCSDSLDPCRRTIDGVKETTCSRRGDCECGKCICDFPYRGDFCEYHCPTKKGKICSDHGICTGSDTCTCNPGYSGTDCSCEEDTKKCQIFGQICNQHGTCTCNKCICEKDYRGKLCEYYIGQKKEGGFCEEFKNLTLNYVVKGDENIIYKDAKVDVYIFDHKITEEGSCFLRYSNDTHYCEITYLYNLENRIQLKIQSLCYKSKSAAIIAPIIVLATVIGGLILILIYKYYTYVQDKREYARFEKEQNLYRSTRIENPLYNSPITSYRVPGESKNK